MRHQEFLEGVSTRGGFTASEDARRAADAVLAAVAVRLPDDDRRALADALPTLLEQEAGVDGADRTAATGDTAVVDDTARRTGWAPERARYAVLAVTGELAAQDPRLGERIASVLPDDLVGGGPTLPPDAGSEGQQGRPQPVEADELSRALQRLVDWSGDRSGIERTIELPAERLDRVLERIRVAEHAMSHRTRVVERTPTTLTLRARTESLQAVTRLDLELADRVDTAVADAM